MPYGIDVSRYQSGLDLRALSNDDFVIIKLGGTNIAPIYTSATAAEQVRSARAAGKHVGFYWVTGNVVSVAEQARYAAAAAKRVGYRDGDLVALDNEELDSHGQMWDDSKSAAWLTSVRALLGCSYKNLALYGSSGSLFRPRTWTRVKQLGVHIWVAAYGNNDGRSRTSPNLAGTGLSWTIHQYTSNYRQQGMSLDRNYTAQTASKLFRSYKTSSPISPAVSNPTSKIAKTTTAATGGPGKRGSNAWKRLQLLARKGGYKGPIDGDLGAFSWEGIQRHLSNLGIYNGRIDGEPAKLTVVALQVWAGVADPTATADVLKIGRGAWRRIGAKLNTL